MIVKNLTLKNFRNYENQQISFSDSTNIICGRNANGKTNILEAIYLFSCGKSHRAHSDSEMINFEKDSAQIKIEFESRGREFKAVMNISRSGKKIITVNNVPVRKLSKLISYLNVILFSPDDLAIVKGSPSGRRKFMDSAICRMHPSYMAALSEYQKAAAEKNILLKDLRKKGVSNDAYLSVWNEQLAEAAEKIVKYRQEFVNEISSLAAEIQRNISSEELHISYEANLKQEKAKDIFEFLEKNQFREINAASMCYGIQRDDIAILIGTSDARIYASQGQQRTAALSLKIAEADYIYAHTGEYPVLLLDDIMSELDLGRRMYLWQKVTGKQVMITCTDTDIFENKHGARLFTVKNNAVTNTDFQGSDADVSTSG